jgi:hypothetical protein
MDTDITRVGPALPSTPFGMPSGWCGSAPEQAYKNLRYAG